MKSIGLDTLYRLWKLIFNGPSTLQVYRHPTIGSTVAEMIFGLPSLWMKRTARTGLNTNICWKNGLTLWLFHGILHPPCMSTIVLGSHISMSRGNWASSLEHRRWGRGWDDICNSIAHEHPLAGTSEHIARWIVGASLREWFKLQLKIVCGRIVDDFDVWLAIVRA